MRIYFRSGGGMNFLQGGITREALDIAEGASVEGYRTYEKRSGRERVTLEGWSPIALPILRGDPASFDGIDREITIHLEGVDRPLAGKAAFVSVKIERRWDERAQVWKAYYELVMESFAGLKAN